MRRRLLSIASALSLLLSAATAAMWGRSYKVLTPWTPELPRGGYRLVSWRGQLVLVHHRSIVAPPWVWVMTTVYMGTDIPTSNHQRVALVKGLICDPAHPFDRARRDCVVLSRPYVPVSLADGIGLRNGGGFGLAVSRLSLPRLRSGPPRGWTWTQSSPVLWAVATPYWLLMLLSAALPTRSFARYQRSRRALRRGRCVFCNYDLRASTERCPECGTPVPKKAEATA